MYHLLKLQLLFILANSVASCESNHSGIIQPDHHYLSYMGRIDRRTDGGVALISSAASVSGHLSGTNCIVYLRNEAPAGQYNYVVFELNEEWHADLRG